MSAPGLFMPQPHTIRLNGPWEMIARGTEPPQRVKLPEEWPVIMSAASAGPVFLQRWFHRPTGLTPNCRVQLVFQSLPFSGSASIDDVQIGVFSAHSEQAINISAVIRDRSCLTLSVTEPVGAGNPMHLPQISLAIHPSG